MGNPIRLIEASSLEISELLVESDQALCARLQDVQRQIKTLPADQLGSLVDPIDRLNGLNVDRLAMVSDGVETLGGILRHLDEAAVEDRPAILRTQAAGLEAAAVIVQVLALTIDVGNDIRQRLLEEEC